MIYRRRIIYDTREGIEIVPAVEGSKQLALDDLYDFPIKVVMESIEMDKGSIENGLPKIGTQIYNVMLPDGLRVKPANWKELAYDHDEVSRLVQVCINDNASRFIFGPFSESLFNSMDKELSIALEDLSSLIDNTVVRCEAPDSSPGMLTALVKFEHKNGEKKEILFTLNP